MASKSAKNAVQMARQVKPMLSVDKDEAKRRVLSLYKAWHRQIPYMLRDFALPITRETAYKQLRKKFMEKSHVTDIRVIDMLVVKGQQDLKEVVEIWAQSTHIMSKHFREAHKERPKDFMSKFLSGQE